MKTPRNVSGPELLKALRVLGYERIRQDGYCAEWRDPEISTKMGNQGAAFSLAVWAD